MKKQNSMSRVEVAYREFRATLGDLTVPEVNASSLHWRYGNSPRGFGRPRTSTRAKTIRDRLSREGEKGAKS